MSYIGGVSTGYNVQQTVRTQAFNGDSGNTVFTLNYHVNETNDIEVLVNNVQQSPFDGSYSASGTTLTFAAPPSSGSNNIYVIYRTYSIPNYFRANTTVEGVVLLVDSISNTSISHAATANSVKTVYDAISIISGAAATAYANAVAYANTISDTAYANSIAYANTISDTAYTNAVSAANTLAFNFAANAYSNSVAYANTISDTAYTNAVSAANTLAFNFAANAYSNSVAYANTISDTAYTNAVSAANTLAFNFAANAYANATSYTDNAVANLVNSAPSTLDTLQELANALGNDANFSTTVLTGIGNAYTNAVTYTNTYASNATNLTTGTVNAALLSTSGVVANTYGNTTAIPVLEINDKGIVVNASTSSISGVTGLSYTASNSTITVSTSTTSYDAQITALNIGNSTVNTAINSTAVVIDGTLETGNTTITGSVFANGELVVANSTSNVFSVASNGNVTAEGSVFARSPFFENATEVLSNYTIAANVNAMSVGPLTVANGVAVTVSSGSRWVII